ADTHPIPLPPTAAFGAVGAIGGASTLGRYPVRSKGRSSPPAASTEKAAEFDWIMQAMADCEAQAKQKTDTLHFLIVPMTTTGVSVPGWSAQPIGSVGNSGMLLSSSDALFGLRNHVLVLYDRPVAFAVSDPASDTVLKWKPAVGVSSLKTRQSFDRLKLGFQMSESADQIEWGPTVKIENGSCYWIMAL